MGKTCESCIPIKTPADLSVIRYQHEREFARLLIDHNPSMEITYEPGTFTHTNGNGRLEATIPDFHLRNSRKPGSPGIFVELTSTYLHHPPTADSPNLSDPKERQKNVMKDVEPSVRYVVLYRENLEKIQKVHPEYDFRNGK